MDGGRISTFTAQFISLGQARRENSNGVKSRYILLGLKNAKSFIGKVQKIMLFEGDDFAAETYDLLKKYSSPSQTHEEGFDVNISAFKASEEFRAAPDRWGLLLNYPGGMTVEYKFSKGLCYANNVDGQPVTDKLGNYITKDRVSVFCQVDFYSTGANGETIAHYIEPYSPSTQGQRIESKFFTNAVHQMASTDDDGIYTTPVVPVATAAAPVAPVATEAAPDATAPAAPAAPTEAPGTPTMPF